MSKTAVITARVNQETLGTLDRLAQIQERSRSWMVAKAVDRFVEQEAGFFDLLEEGREAIEKGDFLTHDELVAEIRAMAPRGK